MAALQFAVNSSSVALTAATAMTVLQLTAPANQRVKINQISVTFDGSISSAIPATVSIYRQTTAGTVTAAPPSPVLLRKGLTEVIQTAVTWKATAEPTYGDLIRQRFVPTYGGTWDMIAPYSQEIEIQGGGRLGVVVNALVGVNVEVSISGEE